MSFNHNLVSLRHFTRFVLILAAWWKFDGASGFNMDTKNIRVVTGQTGSQFGFSAQFLPQAPGDKNLKMVVGAPKADTQDGGSESGTIYFCNDILNPAVSCGNTLFVKDNAFMVNGTVNEGFGSTLVPTDSSDILVCSPRWKDTSTFQSHYFFMPGRCTLYNSNNGTAKHIMPFFHLGKDKSYYVMDIDGGQEYYHGLASYGFSVDSDKKSIYTVGAPGVLMFEGSIQIMDQKTGEFSFPTSLRENKLATTAYGYLGYSVKIGKFCKGSDVCFAAGAPNHMRTGRVSLYTWENRKYLRLLQLIPGMQAWSFFGSTLCAADVDGDGYDELLVGAPHHCDERDATEGFDQGRVYVYSRTSADESQIIDFKVTLDGMRKKYARFGTAIQNIGDINLDKYTDVAVGAPGEDDGAGSVYIYLGGPAGLSSSHSQRITAAQVSAKLSSVIKGFGFSFSDHKVPQNQKYPVFAASSVLSDTLVVFKCRPIIDVKSTITATPNPVDLEKPCMISGVQGACFKVTFCLEYEIRGQAKRQLSFNIFLEVDSQTKSSSLKRALLLSEAGLTVESLTQTMTPTEGTGKCISFDAVLRESQVNQDRFTPIQVVATYELAKNVPTDMDPVLDALKPNNVSTAVTFKNECGDDNKCRVDLNLTAAVGYKHSGSWESIVVNHTKELVVNVSVANSQETSYWTVTKIHVNSVLPFSRFSSDIPVSCQSVEPSSDVPADAKDNTAAAAAATALADSAQTTVLCNYYKPLRKNENIRLSVGFDTEHISLSHNELTITAEAKPKDTVNNPEITPDDNKAVKMSSVDIIADVSVDGSSSPSETTVQEAKRISLTSKLDISKGYHKSNTEVKKMNVTHKILVRNNGPSFLPRTTINVSVPLFLPDGSLLVHEADVKLATAAGQVIQCRETVQFDLLVSTEATTPSTTPSTGGDKISSTSGSGITGSTTAEPSVTTDDSWIPFVGPINRKRRAARKARDVLDKIYTMSCELDPQYCQKYVCELTTVLPPDSHAEITASLVLDKANVPIPQDFNTFYFLTKTEVSKPSHPLFKPWNDLPTVETLTIFHFVHSGGKINIWIIVGCVIAGLVLITIIVIVFWKLGFFKRDKHYQVERWKRESQRRSRKGYSKAATDDDAGAAPAPDGDS